jgi:tripartite-type tricarboxylate transporter receptor subunit TctC
MGKYLCVAAFLMTTLVCAQSQAQTGNYPNRPVRLVLGPSPDLLSRMVGQKLSEIWGQQLVIDQRPAAGGIIAGETVAKAPADGYTWLLSTASFVTLSGLYPKLPYDFLRDFTPVALMGSLPWVVVVHPSVPAKTLAEFVQLARAKPGQMNYANPGNGTSTHIVTEMFLRDAGIKLVNIPYKGVAASLTDLVGGQAQMSFGITQASVPHVLSGRLRALAVSTAKRLAALPEVPTLAESGFKDMDVVGWNGVHVPTGTPPALIAQINRNINEVLKMRDIQERMTAAGFEIGNTTVPEFAAFVKRDFDRYGKVIREANIRAD